MGFTGFFHPELSGVIFAPTYHWFFGPTLWYPKQPFLNDGSVKQKGDAETNQQKN